EAVYGTPGSAATPDQIAQIQALGQLTGQDISGFLGNTAPNGQIINPDIQGLGQLKPSLQQSDLDFVKSVNLPTPEQIQIYPSLGTDAAKAAETMNRLLIGNNTFGDFKRMINDDGKANWLLQYNNSNPVQVIQTPDGATQMMKWNGRTFDPYTPPPGGGGTV